MKIIPTALDATGQEGHPLTATLWYIKPDYGNRKCKKVKMDATTMRLLMDNILQCAEIEVLTFKPLFQIATPAPCLPTAESFAP